jgi:hypothetical protein
MFKFYTLSCQLHLFGGDYGLDHRTPQAPLPQAVHRVTCQRPPRYASISLYKLRSEAFLNKSRYSVSLTFIGALLFSHSLWARVDLDAKDACEKSGGEYDVLRGCVKADKKPSASAKNKLGEPEILETKIDKTSGTMILKLRTDCNNYSPQLQKLFSREFSEPGKRVENAPWEVYGLTFSSTRMMCSDNEPAKVVNVRVTLPSIPKKGELVLKYKNDGLHIGQEELAKGYAHIEMDESLNADRMLDKIPVFDSSGKEIGTVR